MTLEELKDRQRHLYNKYMDERYQLTRAYALEHSPYKIGDIVKDYRGKIKIESIGLYMTYNDTPACVYKGIEYKADNTPKKSGAKREIYQENIK